MIWLPLQALNAKFELSLAMQGRSQRHFDVQGGVQSVVCGMESY